MQTKLSSLTESILNVGSGFFLSLLIWVVFVKPTFNITTSFSENLMITFTFTFVSVLRGYAWRRLFNKIGVNK